MPSATRLADCLHCGTLQHAPVLPAAVDCAVCASPLVRTRGRSQVAALAFCAAALLLWIPANGLSFLTTAIVGVSRESRLASSATAMWNDGFPELGVVVALFVFVLPVLRLGLLAAVLGTLQTARRPAWLGSAFRLATAMQAWAMDDVFLLAFAVAYARLAITIPVEMGAGAWCFVAAAILGLLARASLDAEGVWRAIGPETSTPAAAAVFACGSCDLLLPRSSVGARCPRCTQRLTLRKPDSIRRTLALLVAAVLLYVPSNLYPMATLPVGLESLQYTVLEGVVELWESGLGSLAVLVFVASFAIPVLKLAVLFWCLAAVWRRSGRHLSARTGAHRIVEEIGRWSMVDPFVIACFVPVTQYNTLLHGSAEAAASMFTAVVILTTLAARTFDPRSMWDAAARTDAR